MENDTEDKTNNIFQYDTGFAPVPYAAMRDEKLTICARGLLALMMTHSQKWKFNNKDLMKKCGCGKDKFAAMKKELIDAGYLEISREKDPETGLFIGYVWKLNSVRSETGQIRLPDNPASGKTIHHKDNNNKDIQSKDSPPPPKCSEIDFSKVDPSTGTLASMDKEIKYPFPNEFYPGTEIKDFALIDLRLYVDEYKDAVINFSEYWRDRASNKNGKKTPRGWKAALKTWLRKDATSLKAKWRDQPHDYRRASQNDIDDAKEINAGELPVEYWEAHVMAYHDRDEWKADGPKPDAQNCKAPLHILQKYGFSL